MKIFRAQAFVLVALVLVSGCGIFKTEEQQRSARTRERPLEVPPDLTTPAADDRYAVPDPRASTSFSQYSRDRTGITPGTPAAAVASGVLPAIANARIERGGDQRWIVAKAEPVQVWPIVREFWLDMGFSIEREAPGAGILETNWRESRPKVETTGIRGMISRALPGMYSSGERDRFRSRLERGAEPGTTEIFISHRGLEEVFTSVQLDATRWQPRGSGYDRDLEAEMLGRLLVKLGESAKKASPGVPGGKPGAESSVTAAVAPGEPANAVLENSGAGPLMINDGFDRAWRRVGLALDRVSFTVEDRDRSKGVFFVRYIDPDAATLNAPGGFLDKLAFWRPAARASQPQYRIQVVDSGGGRSTVTVNDAKGAPETSATGRRILALLFEQLK